MRKKFKHIINYMAICIAFTSFLLGTGILLAYKIYHIKGLPSLGFSFLIGAYGVNLLMLLVVIINSILHTKDYKEHIITIAIMLLNIPISNWYADIAL